MKPIWNNWNNWNNWNACPKIISVLILLPAPPKSPFPLESLNSVYLSLLLPLMMRSSLAAPWQKSWKVKLSVNCGRLKVG